MDEGKQADGGYDPSAPPQKNAEAQDGDDTILVNASKQQGKDSKAKHQDGQVSSSKKRKRGMKPRSKRNRKRRRGGVGVHNLNGDGGEEGGERHTVEVEIKPLVFPKESSDEDVGRQTNEKETANNGQRRIRVIKPYPFTFATFAKARWVGRSIIDVYFKEFGSYPKSYYESAIGEGRILVSGTKVTCEYKVKGGDELSHVVHRHEPAVSICEGDVATGDSEMIKVVHNDENIIVVDKPSTLPVHPCGGYNFNSLFHILATQDPSLEGKLFTVHRLDRLTSGLTIVAKSTQVAQVLGKCISDRENCNKIYVARVKGQFPKLAPQTDKLRFEGDVDANVAPFLNGERNMDGLNLNEKCSKGYWITDEENSIVNSATLDEVFESRLEVTNLGENGNITGQTVSWLHLACPCEITCHKNGICKAGSGKAAQTAFAVIGYDPKSDSTVVLAKPSTG
jgi:23S rRNA-/tRNA-specific pseudouridylate synthase